MDYLKSYICSIEYVSKPEHLHDGALYLFFCKVISLCSLEIS